MYTWDATFHYFMTETKTVGKTRHQKVSREHRDGWGMKAR